MKTIILCGGLGTRMKEETEYKPKGMVLVGGKPILWHIMKIYAHYGYNEFVLALGYKGEMIKDYFLGQKNFQDDFKIIFADTGLESNTGERILRAQKYITENNFMLTYGDGVSDINIKELVAFHQKHGLLGTISGVHPYSKYGLIKTDGNNLVESFDEKPLMHDYVSGGFMIFNRNALKYFDNGHEQSGLKKMAAIHQLSVYKHEGFWKAMDTYREMEELNKLWEGERPWTVWEK